MKIGLISINMYSKALNYACPLHNYAFQQFLRKHGIDSTIINYLPIYFNHFDMENPYQYYKKLYSNAKKKNPTTLGEKEKNNRHIKEYLHKAKAWKQIRENRSIRYHKFQNFIDTRYKKTETLYDSDLLEIMDPGFDCYICVTDVIWKSEPDFGYDRGFFLGSTCMENKWKIAYSASANVLLPNNRAEEKQFFHYINDIDFISVREQFLSDFINSHSDKKSVMVVDPVLLLDREFYEEFAVKPKDDHYILVYCVVENKKYRETTVSKAAAFAREHHLKIIELTDRPLDESSFAAYTDIESVLDYTAGIEEWLGYFLHADYIFTNSFHGCCFSILFHKEFFIGPRNERKITNLLEMLDIRGRKLTDPELDLHNPQPLPYDRIQPALERERKKSEDFILSAIQYAQTHERPKKDYTQWKKELTFPVFYHSGIAGQGISWTYEDGEGKINKLSSGAAEFTSELTYLTNSGQDYLLPNRYTCRNHYFTGWYIRYRIDNQTFWYLKDGSSCPTKSYDPQNGPARYLCRPGDPLPVIPTDQISSLVAEAVWKAAPSEKEGEEDPAEYLSVTYQVNSIEGQKLYWTWESSDGKVEAPGNVQENMTSPAVLAKDTAAVFIPAVSKFRNNGKSCLLPNQFLYAGYHFKGWNLKYTLGQEEHWLMSGDEKYLSAPGTAVPRWLELSEKGIRSLTAVAVWEKYIPGISAIPRTSYTISYNSGKRLAPLSWTYDETKGVMSHLLNDSEEYQPEGVLIENNGTVLPEANKFHMKGYRFVGWTYRYYTPYTSYWLLYDGSVQRVRNQDKSRDIEKYLYVGGEKTPVPAFPSDYVVSVVAEARWEENLITKGQNYLQKIQKKLLGKQ